MSVQWGLWSFNKALQHRGALEVLPRYLAQWGPDSNGLWSDDSGLTIGARSFHITHEDLRQVQPYESPETGNVFTFDGRIDNRGELMSTLSISRSRQTQIIRGAWDPAAISSAPFPILVGTPKQSTSSLIQPAQWLVPQIGVPTDLELVAAAFDRWNVDCFGRLLGEWAITVWEKQHKTLWLAKDAFGPRHLHYIYTDHVLCWSTRHECISRLIREGHLPSTKLTPDYRYRAASAIALAPVEATPYNEIRSVPPAYAVAIREGQLIKKVRTSMPPRPVQQKMISFERAAVLFRSVLERSLLRRTRSAFPVTFELSGGCDSSTLVCLAHELRRRGKLSQEIYTITCYSRSQLQSQDRRYARLVEDHIGQHGRHIPVYEIADNNEVAKPLPEELQAWDEVANALLEHSPSLAMRELWVHRARYTDILRERGSRVLICGVGGDELAGGAQYAASSLADEWAFYSMPDFFCSLKNWARYTNETVWRLLGQIAVESVPLVVGALLDGSSRRQAAAAHAHFVGISKSRLRMMKFAFSGTIRPWRSYRHQSDDTWPMSVVLSHKQRLCHIGCWHRSFPYIDADWIKLASLLPSIYIQTAFHRRRLIREAASGFVPESVLWRRTKDYGMLTARGVGGTSKRRLRDLEENAALFQIIRAASNFGRTEAIFNSDAKNREVIEKRTIVGLTKDSPSVIQNDEDSFSIAAHVRFVSDKNGATLLDTARGKRVVLNTAGAEIWRGLVDGNTIGGIAHELANRYNIPLKTARSDTSELVADFVQNGVLVPSPSPKERKERTCQNLTK